MSLDIQTFSAAGGGAALFKALGHPALCDRATALIRELAGTDRLAVYDPEARFATFAALHDVSAWGDLPIFTQSFERLSRQGDVQPLTALGDGDWDAVFVAAFDARRRIGQISHLVGESVRWAGFDDLRLPDGMLTNRRRYLDPLNFATNFAFFRDDDRHHTRLVTANYWGAYGAESPRLWATLFDIAGRRIATWEQELGPPNGTIVIDSAEVRGRFGLGPFTGQLFLHIIGAVGHDVVKYALDCYGASPDELSCTHDANAWPADHYAGLPAPQAGESVILWLQNSHPCPIAEGEIRIGAMGAVKSIPLRNSFAAFETHPVRMEEVAPQVRWPAQFEIFAGKYFVRPRYEVVRANGRRRIAHVNVERSDLVPDPRLADLSETFGKGFLLPAPILPSDRYDSCLLPTPMARSQKTLPIRALIVDGEGQELARHDFGNMPRGACVDLDVGALAGAALAGTSGHVELVYNFAAGREADGWLHAIFRYVDRQSGHGAETSFGAHMFNSPMTYKGEPQSYAGPPPGLSTRLFLRTGPAERQGFEAFCHLIYPASTPWHPLSRTELSLVERQGGVVARAHLAIPCGGSRRFEVGSVFAPEDLQKAGEDAYILVRDPTCRLFGYQGLRTQGGSFSLDHMFGF